MSRSEKRVRTAFRGVRFFEDEDQQLQAWADQLGCTVPELIRAVMFNRPPRRNATCSSAHPSCSPQHFAMVQGYRLARHADEMQLEAVTGGHDGDHAHWKAKGGKLVTFGQWLKAHTTREEPHGEQAV